MKAYLLQRKITKIFLCRRTSRTSLRTEKTGHNATVTSGSDLNQPTVQLNSLDPQGGNLGSVIMKGQTLTVSLCKTQLSLLSMRFVLLLSASVLPAVKIPAVYVNTQSGGWLLVFSKHPAETEW